MEKRESELATGNIEEQRGYVQDILYERRIKNEKKVLLVLLVSIQSGCKVVLWSMVSVLVFDFWR